MQVLTKITIKNLKLNKKRTIGTLVGIILSVALICAVAGMATSLRQSLIQTASSNTGYWHLKLSNINKEDIEKLKNNRDIKDLNIINDVGYAKLAKSANENRPYIHLYSLDEKSFNNMELELVEGTYPQNNNEIAISKSIIDDAQVDLKIGDTITFNIGDRYIGDRMLSSGYEFEPAELMNEPENVDLILSEMPEDSTKETDVERKEEIKVNFTKEFTIVGIMSENEQPIKPISFMYDAGYACVTNGLDEGETNAYIAFKNPLDSETSIDEILRINLNSGEISEYSYSINYELLKWESFNTNLGDSSLNMMIAVVIIVIAIIILTSVYCIKNTFSISLTEKIKMYGMLSSIGATKKQIKKSVIQEGMILSLIGIPVGILVGILLVYILVIAVRGALSGILDIVVSKITLLPILISIILGIVTVYLSCLSAARKAKKITPLEAIKSSNDIKIKSKKIKSPKIIKKIFGVGGVIAYKNLKRSKKKYRTTVISIAMSVFVFIASSTLINYAFEAMGGYYKDYDYNIKFSSTSSDGQELKQILNDENFSNYTLLYKTNSILKITDMSKLSEFGKTVFIENDLYKNNEIPVEIYGLNSEDFKEYLEKLGVDYDKNKDKAVLLDYYSLYKEGKTIKNRLLTYSPNDSISGNVEDKEFNVSISKITETVPDGLEGTYFYSAVIVLNIDEYGNNFNFVPNMLTTNSEEPDDLAKRSQKYDNMYVTNIASEVRFYDSVRLVVYIFAYGFIGIITLIGVTNIFNTLTSNIDLRQREFAMLKSIGMTKKEFNKMINLETLFYSLKALIFGIVLGLIASFAIYKAFAQSLDYGFKIPMQAILISILFVFVIVFIIMKFAIGKINKQNIIDTIRKENI